MGKKREKIKIKNKNKKSPSHRGLYWALGTLGISQEK
jgi:hypothetical protein